MELASLGQRAKGAVIDGAVAVVPYLLITRADDEVVLKLAGIAFFLAMAGVQFYFLARDGQSLGKKAAGTRIVRVDTEQNGGFVTNVLLRAVVGSLGNAVGIYWFVDNGMVFRKDRRTLHDLIARTKVVRAAQ